MPDGYLVSLGTNNSLDEIDGISGGLVSFTTSSTIGAGEWIWSGTFGGTTYTNELEPGVFYLATDGNVYFVPDLGPVTTLTEGSVISGPSFSLDDGVVEGTDDAELINSGYTDIDGSQVSTGADVITAGDGDDTIIAQGGADTITGDGGNDSINGGGGADVISGDSGGAVSATDEILIWDDVVNDEVDVSSGFVISTGVIDVTFSATDDGNNAPVWSIESSDLQYTEAGEPFGTNSALYLFGNGDGATSTTTFTFSADDRAYTGAVEDVSFRLNDLDFGSGNHTDVVTVNAYLDGVAVTVTITPEGTQTVSGNTISGTTATDADDAAGSVLIEIEGPVDEIEIIYSNGQSGTQAVYVTDIAFTSIPAPDGDDTINGGDGADVIDGEGGADVIDGGSGNDTIDGGAGDDDIEGGTGDDSMDGGLGNDTIDVAQGDTVSGGDGDDLFVLTDLGEAGSQDITIVGGETGESGGDTLDLATLAALSSVVITNSDDTAGGLSGYATMNDGSTVFFSEIETIICFTRGTRILTETGERAVEALRPGDLIVTRDQGLQPLRWRASSRVSGRDKLAPVRIPTGGRFGARRSLLVSPQHRMLEAGWRADLTFGTSEVLVAAKHLIGDGGIAAEPCDRIDYFHLGFDRHQVIFAEGAATESFHPGHQGMEALSARARESFFASYPELRASLDAYGPTARPVARGYEALALAG